MYKIYMKIIEGMAGDGGGGGAVSGGAVFGGGSSMGNLSPYESGVKIKKKRKKRKNKKGLK